MFFKNAPTPAKVDNDGGTVSGYASTFDREPDSYGDIVAPGAFADSLKRWSELGKPIPLLYGHNVGDPKYNIGMITKALEDEKGLYVEGDFDADSETAQQTRHLVQTGRLYQFSFAFDVLEWGEVELEDGRKVNELRKLELYEVSLVQIPANQHAEVTEIKGVKYGRRNSKSDEDTIREAIDLLQSILDNEQEDEGDSSSQQGAEGDEGDDPKGREVDAENTLMAFIKSIEEKG